MLIKKNVKFGLVFFVLLTTWKWLSSAEIYWLENMGISIAIAVVYMFMDWADKPYEYKRTKGKNIDKDGGENGYS